MEGESKFNTVLQKKVEEKKEEKEKQEALRKEFGIKEGQTVGVRMYQNNLLESVWKIFCDIIRLLATIVILFLAAIGLIALVIPDIREPLQLYGIQIMEQLQSFIPFISL